ncbi:hypothetical protein ACHAW6_011298 [Cyclotella cf. meneghiniana]
MSKNRYESLLQALSYTKRPSPNYNDPFHEQHQLEEEFNDHYQTESPGWQNSLNESISIWLNKYCPGFLCVPRNPHPFGNDYHAIWDSEFNLGCMILWHAEIQERKDCPTELGPKKHNKERQLS